MTMEQAGKIAASVVESLRASPVVLALIVLNIVFMILIFFAVKDVRKNQHEHMSFLLDRCVPARVEK
jgi:heme/copper-type cytochrome/quinol oxidase subunit 2